MRRQTWFGLNCEEWRDDDWACLFDGPRENHAKNRANEAALLDVIRRHADADGEVTQETFCAAYRPKEDEDCITTLLAWGLITGYRRVDGVYVLMATEPTMAPLARQRPTPPGLWAALKRGAEQSALLSEIPGLAVRFDDATQTIHFDDGKRTRSVPSRGSKLGVWGELAKWPGSKLVDNEENVYAAAARDSGGDLTALGDALEARESELLAKLRDRAARRVSGAPAIDWSTLVESVPCMGDDRVDVFQSGDAFTFVLADGAGGMEGGGDAAVRLTWRVRTAAESGGLDLDGWRALFTRVDREIATSADGGETTGVVVVISPRGVMGVSAGDSEAWVVTPSGIDDLTAGQSRKRLGSGRAAPVTFSRPALDGTLVVASDGLWKYASAERIVGAVRGRGCDEAADALRALVRLPSGRYQDDLALVVVAGARP